MVVYQSTQDFGITQVGELMSNPCTKNNLYEEYTNINFSTLDEKKHETFHLRLDQEPPVSNL